MINLYDGNNIMMRALLKPSLGQARPMSLRMRYEQVCAKPIGTELWVWDGHKHNERRQEIYPLYKANRQPKGEDLLSQIRLWKTLLGHSPATQFEVYGWEGDDIIATLARQFAAKGLPCTIHSTDMDYAQLDHFPTVTLNGVNTKGVPSRWVPLYKAMNGDSSDNIKGIPGFGPKRWVEMEEYWPQIERAIVAGSPAGFLGLPFKPAVAAWLAVPDNILQLQAMLTVTHFENVPADELGGGIKMGSMNRVEAHSILTRYFL